MLRFLLPITLFVAIVARGGAAEPVVVGSLTIRVADLFANEVMKPLMKLQLMEDEVTMAEFVTQTGISPNQLQRMTAVYFSVKSDNADEFLPVIVSTSLKPIDAAAIVKEVRLETLAASGTIHGQPKLALHMTPWRQILGISDKQVFIVGMSVPKRFVLAERGPIIAQISDEQRDLVAGMIAKAVPIDAERSVAMTATHELVTGTVDVPALVKTAYLSVDRMSEDLQPLTRATHARLAMTLAGRAITYTKTADFASENEAKAGLVAANSGRDITKVYFGLLKSEATKATDRDREAIIDFMSAILSAATVTRDGKSVAFQTKFEITHEVVNTLTRHLTATRAKTRRELAILYFKQLGLAYQGCADTCGRLPDAHFAKDGKTPLLSWRVMILPFMEEGELANRFKYDEPWDSEHNKKLIPLMPQYFTHPNIKTEVGHTFVQGFVGEPTHRFHPTILRGVRSKLTLDTIPDGVKSTIVFAEAATAVPWTKPDDIAFDPDGLRPKIGAHWLGVGFLACFGDGTVRMLTAKTNDTKLKLLIQVNDGEKVDADEK